MLSRFGKVSNLAVKQQSILYRAVATSSNKSADVAVKAGEPRRYPHDAPERDFTNFPSMQIPEHGGKLRLGLIPDEWFKAMYPKTGVTGPYILFWGSVATLFSKEYLIWWADSAEQLVFLAALVYGSKKYDKQIGEYLDKLSNDKVKEVQTELANQSKEIDASITANEQLKSLPEANALVNAAKRENIQLQLESEYRSRVSQVYQEVKKRLDYQVAVQGVHKRLERNEAVNYIIGEVNKSIGPTQQKEAFQSGLEILKGLSKKHAGTI